MSTHSDWLREHAAHMESCCDAYESGQMYDDAQKCKATADALDAAERALRKSLQSLPIWTTSHKLVSEALEHFND